MFSRSKTRLERSSGLTRASMAVPGFPFFRKTESPTAVAKDMQLSLESLSPGEHTISLRVFDISGNVGTLSPASGAKGEPRS